MFFCVTLNTLKIIASLLTNFQIVHNASIMNAVSCCGLQLYNFGETVSIPYWTETWKPDSFFEKIENNFSRNLHTLCLLGKFPPKILKFLKPLDYNFFCCCIVAKKCSQPFMENLSKKVIQFSNPDI